MDKIFLAEYSKQFKPFNAQLFVQSVDRNSSNFKFGKSPEIVPQFGGQMPDILSQQNSSTGRPKFYSYNEDLRSPLQLPTGLKIPSRYQPSITEEKEASPNYYERSSLRQNRQASFIEPNQRYNEEKQPRSARGTQMGEIPPYIESLSPPKQQYPSRPFPESGSPYNKASQRSRSQMQTDPAMNDIFQNTHRVAPGGIRIDQLSQFTPHPQPNNQRYPVIQEFTQRQRSGNTNQPFSSATSNPLHEDKFKLQVYIANSTQSNPSEPNSYSSPGYYSNLQAESPDERLQHQTSPSDQSDGGDSNIEAQRASASSYMTVSRSGSPRSIQNRTSWPVQPRFVRNNPTQYEHMRTHQPTTIAMQQNLPPYILKPPAAPIFYNSMRQYSSTSAPLHIQSDGGIMNSTPDFRFDSGFPSHKQPSSQMDGDRKSYLRYSPGQQPMPSQYSSSSHTHINQAGVFVNRTASPDEWRKDKTAYGMISSQHLTPGPLPLIQKIDLTSQYLPSSFLHTRSDPLGEYPAPDRRPPATSSHQPMH